MLYVNFIQKKYLVGGTGNHEGNVKVTIRVGPDTYLPRYPYPVKAEYPFEYCKMVRYLAQPP